MIEKVKIVADGPFMHTLKVVAVDEDGSTAREIPMNTRFPILTEITTEGAFAVIRIPVEEVNFKGRMR
jgi:hypothetical protein